MKKLYNLLFLIVSHLLFSQNINIPDANFKALLLQSSSANNIAADLNGNSIKIDQNDDGEIQVSEAENIAYIYLNNRSFNYLFYFFGHLMPSPNYPIKDIYSLEGINFFKNLKILDCAYSKISTLDFTNLSKLEQLYCNDNQIESFTNFQYVKNLYGLDCSKNLLTNIDMSHASINSTKEAVLYIFSNNKLQSLNLQNGKKTKWACLCDYDWSCPFSYEINFLFSTCFFDPGLSTNPTLTELKINCFEKEQYLYQFPFAIDNCSIYATTDVKNLKDKVKIFQNLTYDLLIIDTQLYIEKYSIIDISGRIIKTENSNNKNIDISKIAKGTYFIKIETKEGIINKQFLKN